MDFNPAAPPFQASLPCFSQPSTCSLLFQMSGPASEQTTRGRGRSKRKGRGRGRGQGRGRGSGSTADEAAVAPTAASSTPSSTPSSSRACRYDRSPAGCTKPGCRFVHTSPRPAVALPAPAASRSNNSAPGSQAPADDSSHRGRGAQGRGQSRDQASVAAAPIVLLQRGDADEPAVRKPKQRQRRQKSKPDSEAPRQPSLPKAAPPNDIPVTHDLSASITSELDTERYECMICLDRIRRRAPTWNCSSCHRVLHLECAHRWGKTSSAQGESSQWQCPGCRAELNSLPKAYLCFCGQTKQPQDDGYTHAHSCGEVCGGRRPGCKHPCNEPCHAGTTASSLSLSVSQSLRVSFIPT